MKTLGRIIVIAIFDFIAIYGTALIIMAIVYRIAGWGLNPYLFIAALGLGRIFELFLEKTESIYKQITSYELLNHIKDINIEVTDNDDEKED